MLTPVLATNEQWPGKPFDAGEFASHRCARVSPTPTQMLTLTALSYKSIIVAARRSIWPLAKRFEQSRAVAVTNND